MNDFLGSLFELFHCVFITVSIFFVVLLVTVLYSGYIVDERLLEIHNYVKSKNKNHTLMRVDFSESASITFEFCLILAGLFCAIHIISEIIIRIYYRKKEYYLYCDKILPFSLLLIFFFGIPLYFYILSYIYCVNYFDALKTVYFSLVMILFVSIPICTISASYNILIGLFVLVVNAYSIGGLIYDFNVGVSENSSLEHFVKGRLITMLFHSSFCSMFVPFIPVLIPIV